MLKRKLALPSWLIFIGYGLFVPTTYLNAQPLERSFDARIEYNRNYVSPKSPSQINSLGAMRADQPEIAFTYDDRTGVTSSIGNPTGYLSERDAANPLDIARAYVTTHHEMLGLTAADIADLRVGDLVRSRVSGATHVYFHQYHQDLQVYNGQVQVTVNRNGRVLGINNRAMPEVGFSLNGLTPTVSPAEAVRAVGQHFGLNIKELPRHVRALGGTQHITELRHDAMSRAPIRARLMILPIRRGEARLVWNYQLDRPQGVAGGLSIGLYDLTVDAENGEVWTRFDWSNDASYRVYAAPLESPNHVLDPSSLPPNDGRTLVTDPEDTIASPLGWHSTGTQSFGITRGNNVNAYEDRDANNAPPSSRVPCGESAPCDFGIALDEAPSNYVSAAVTNLFYWSNYIHDVQYHYGFDEEAGNFQINNFGNGGRGGDAVRAEAQDGAGTNNANFATPPDGAPPRMQMFRWTRANPDRDGDLDAGIIVHEYGHGISIRQVGGPRNSGCLNNRQQMGEGWSDLFALIYTAKASDQGRHRRGIGTYSLGQSTNGRGIRTQPYSTDPNINTHTYASIRGKAVPHGVGEVWAQGLWEVYWALVDHYGFSSDLSFDLSNPAAASGNHRAMFYVNEGLKNTACSPTFTDARDGIIQAATDNFGGADVCLLWDAFAAFGLGTDAQSGGPNSTSPVNGFAVPQACNCTPRPVANAGENRQICLGESALIGTPGLTGHSYSWSPGGVTSAQITVTPTLSTTYELTADTVCGFAQDSVQVSVELPGTQGCPTANTAPVVNITDPDDGAVVALNTPVELVATANDLEDGDLSAGITWTSSLNGPLGPGGSLTVNSLLPGDHTITASVTDAGNLPGTDDVIITVQGVVTGPAAIDWRTTPIDAYSNQDVASSGSATPSTDGSAFEMTGNRWRRTTQTYNVTPFTVIEFTFESTSEGEIHGIGFDEDDVLNNDVRIFQLHGTQDWSGADKSYDGSYTSGAMTYTIPVGTFYTGSNMRLVLVNDKDTGSPDHTSRFSNVRVFEKNPEVFIDFSQFDTEAYSNQDASGSVAFEDGGSTLRLSGNRWRRSVQTYTITPNTVIAFEYRSDQEGELHGVGFDENDELNDAPRLINIFGTQNWGGDIDSPSRYTQADIGTYRSFVIPVGSYYTGAGYHLFFVNDDDAGSGTADSRFRNVRIYELQ